MRAFLHFSSMILASAVLAGCNFATLSAKPGDAPQDKATAYPPAPGQAAAQAPAATHLTGVDYVISRVIKEDFQCRDSLVLNVSEAPGNPREFIIKGKNFTYHMVPTVVPSGAIRLENMAQKVIWLQVSGRAMLIDQAKSKRLANECIPVSRLAAHEAEQARAQAAAQAKAQAAQPTKKVAAKAKAATAKAKASAKAKTSAKSQAKK
ncbi:hypothetical protein EBQ26_08140 [Allofranklinella schreckenbergeri]|uniref:Lipoprotein n=1 Tax=Allofranklinella schreckenbergeri TaxID=1076744 RepID=A0A3M6Q3C2_9BURK|nr:hypothetical protein [Allofranklinella schreckenbergeri]RMW97625.1 hypothetical protein EBQ26_08140 [Allofranklinella schreckenbergeri]